MHLHNELIAEIEDASRQRHLMAGGKKGEECVESMDSFVAREKPALVNTIAVCLISAGVIVFCLIKLFMK